MMFNLESDVGDVICLYLAPDSVAGTAKIVVRSEGSEVLALTANEPRYALVEGGRHQTGQCGFRIDEEILPGLSGLQDLEICEAESGVLVYRRPPPEPLDKKIFRIETHLLPLWRLDDALKSRFQYFARGVDGHGRETTTQMFQLNHIHSVYLSGRILYSNYRHYIESKQFDTIFIMHHPYEEMAERLLMLGKIKKVGVGVLGMRENFSLNSTIEFAQSLPLHDESALRKKLYQMPSDVAHAMADPIVRQLTARSPDEPPRGRAVSTALDALASFTVFGLRRDPRTVRAAVAELAGLDPSSLPALDTLHPVGPLARSLKRSRAVEVLLEKDLELYDHIAHAFKKTA